MRMHRFKGLFEDVLSGLDNATVGKWVNDPQTNASVKFADGFEVDFMTVGGAPPGGDSTTDKAGNPRDEVIVTKERPGTEVTFRG